MALTLDLLAAEGKTLSELVAPLPAFAIRKDKATVDRSRLPAIFEGLATRFPDAHVDRDDGLRLAWDDAWLQVRASNTEPIIRIIAEAADPARADALTAAARELAS
jgi:phosphomannomutase